MPDRFVILPFDAGMIEEGMDLRDFTVFEEADARGIPLGEMLALAETEVSTPEEPPDGASTSPYSLCH